MFDLLFFIKRDQNVELVGLHRVEEITLDPVFVIPSPERLMRHYANGVFEPEFLESIVDRFPLCGVELNRALSDKPVPSSMSYRISSPSEGLLNCFQVASVPSHPPFSMANSFETIDAHRPARTPGEGGKAWLRLKTT
ncbi:MAG TPA: hypothetical protein ENI15_16400 [Spirochaetes bacterium]|nr:hypothetical protein [Spirochaetota bacterium]